MELKVHSFSYEQKIHSMNSIMTVIRKQNINKTIKWKCYFSGTINSHVLTLLGSASIFVALLSGVLERLPNSLGTGMSSSSLK